MKFSMPGKARIRLTAVILALAAFLFLATGGCVVRIKEADLFHPNRAVADVRGLPEIQPFEVKLEDGVRVRGWRVECPAADGNLLFLPGNADTAAWRLQHAMHLAKVMRLNVFVVDYRGFGASEGTPSLSRCAKDVLTVRDVIQNQDPQHPMGIYGYSIGTGFASQLAVKRPPDFLVLQAPPTSCEEVIAFWDTRLPWYAGWLVTLKPDPALLDPALRPVDFITQVKCPLLVIHGTADQVIPLVMGEKMFAAADSKQKEMLVLPGLGHNNMDPKDPRIDAALQRLMEQVRGKK